MKTFPIALLLVLLIASAQHTICQTDTLQQAPLDTIVSSAPPQDTVTEKTKKDRKPYDKFKVYGGLTASSIGVNADQYSTQEDLGFALGLSYQRGRFFYWEAGAAWNTTRVKLGNPGTSSDEVLSLHNIDIPLSLGINILSPVDRILGVRVFVGGTPSFLIDVGENDLGIDKNEVNSFRFSAHGGVGVNIIFFYVEAIYKYGLTDVLSTGDSTVDQFQVLLGFRF